MKAIGTFHLLEESVLNCSEEDEVISSAAKLMTSTLRDAKGIDMN